MEQEKFRRGLMTQYPFARGRKFVCKNIGDYIQSVASSQFCHPIDDIIEQEEADKFVSIDGRKTRLIMNGWFQWRAENWPPSKDIIPLLVSMHISPVRQEQLLTMDGIDFLKRNAPVGCRDYYTEKLLKSKGISSYFSGCVTLTLGKNYYVDKKDRSGVFFVDPYFEIPPLYEEIEGKKVLNLMRFNNFIKDYSKHSEIINKLAKKSFFRDFSSTGFLDRDTNEYRPFYKATIFYKIYSQIFSDDILSSADYITHWIDVDMANQTNHDLFVFAENLIKKYSKAKLVITSRIHAGLPCLGLETPVIFIANEEITSENGNFNTPGRLGGLIELFRTFNLEDNRFTTTDLVFSKIQKFDNYTTFENKDSWKELARRLSTQLTKFMSDDFLLDDLNQIRNFQ